MTTFFLIQQNHKYWSLGLELQVSSLGVLVSSRNFNKVSVSKVAVSTPSLGETEGQTASPAKWQTKRKNRATT